MGPHQLPGLAPLAGGTQPITGLPSSVITPPYPGPLKPAPPAAHFPFSLDGVYQSPAFHAGHSEAWPLFTPTGSEASVPRRAPSLSRPGSGASPARRSGPSEGFRRPLLCSRFGSKAPASVHSRQPCPSGRPRRTETCGLPLPQQSFPLQSSVPPARKLCLRSLGTLGCPEHSRGPGRQSTLVAPGLASWPHAGPANFGPCPGAAGPSCPSAGHPRLPKSA
jgi:hypothetical protein